MEIYTGHIYSLNGIPGTICLNLSELISLMVSYYEAENWLLIGKPPGLTLPILSSEIPNDVMKLESPPSNFMIPQLCNYTKKQCKLEKNNCKYCHGIRQLKNAIKDWPKHTWKAEPCPFDECCNPEYMCPYYH